MLIGSPTEFGIGMVLYGDYRDLRSLHDTILTLVGDDDTSSVAETVRGLAYDVRRAFEGKREEATFGRDAHDTVTYRGVKLVWTTVLLQVAVLRSLADRAVLSKDDEANLLRLEHCVETSLRELDPKVAAECEGWMPRLAPRSPGYRGAYVEEAAYQYIVVNGPGKRRIAKLPEVLASMTEISSEYNEFRTKAEAEGRADRPAHEMADSYDWPVGIEW